MAEIKVICGALVVDKGKFVLVQEAQEICRGQWNYPAGHLDLGEDILTAAKREVKEETNLDVELEGLLGVYENHNKKGDNVVKFIFKARVIGGKLKFAKGELLDAKWFSFEEFDKLKDNEIRTLDMRKAVEDLRNGKLFDLNIINFKS